jgi:hypothetical protein
MAEELPYKLERTYDLPGGGTAKLNIGSADPIDQDALLILRPRVALAFIANLVKAAALFKPPGK